ARGCPELHSELALERREAAMTELRVFVQREIVTVIRLHNLRDGWRIARANPAEMRCKFGIRPARQHAYHQLLQFESHQRLGWLLPRSQIGAHRLDTSRQRHII